MISNQAIVDPRARLGESVEVGPWSIIGPDVEIDEGTVIGPHVVVKGPSRIGKNNHVYQFSSIGEDCQDKKYLGEPTRLEIGDNNIFRESCTVHRGTTQDESLTKIGSGNLFMVNAHVAHDVIMGDNSVIANNVAIAGHAHLGNNVVLGGFTGIHQFCRIGSHAMCGVGSVVLKDVPAYVMVSGNAASTHGINVEGLRRRGFSKETITLLQKAYKVVYRQGLILKNAIEQLKALPGQCPELDVFIESLLQSTRGITR